MTFLLDTNVISEMRRPERAALPVLTWVSAQAEETLWCSVISILELEMGALQALRRDKLKGTMLRSWIDERVLPRFQDRIVAIDTVVALKCAALHVPDPKPDRDAYIAATALVHNLTVITRNTRDFASTGVKLFNPWEVAT
ncbi:type II toxin-antitoxin system VapC family toxin [Mesorhizobium sp. IMUNJ 23232]|uniref:type II toxin-antitoxin system VapC family toxin n=1 Tax=Mesorhizobium sp. IMUNJ 23232 TaxID=3376064 RepID=UPI0037A25F62